MRPRAYVTRKLPQAALDIVAANLDYSVWPEEDTAVPRDTLLEAVRDADGVCCLITEKIDREFLNAAPRVKVVAQMAVGYDNIDVKACAEGGVMVTNTPGVLTETTADLAFGLILATARRIPEAERVLRENRWGTWSPMFLCGLDVHHATLGILGLGQIGRAVARRARGFDMKVLYWDIERKKDVEAETGASFAALEDVLSQSDFVTVHLPLTTGTRGLIGQTQLAMMKPTSVLINTARGPIVDYDALKEALEKRVIWGAGLDVYSAEPVRGDMPLVQLDNVVALPHIASASVATRTKMAVMAAENLVAALKGDTPPNLVRG